MQKQRDELAETLKSEIASLKSSPQKQSESSQPALEEVQDFQSLETLRKEAVAAKKWALQNIGRDYVESGGKEYSDDDIRNILTQAEDYSNGENPRKGAISPGIRSVATGYDQYSSVDFRNSRYRPSRRTEIRFRSDQKSVCRHSKIPT